MISGNPSSSFLDFCTARDGVVAALPEQLCGRGDETLLRVRVPADRVVMLDAGLVVATGTPAEIFTSSNIARVFGVNAELDWNGSLRLIGVHSSAHHQSPRRQR